jgi:hypothetical protein
MRPGYLTLTHEQAKALLLAYANLHDCLYDSDCNVSRLGKRWAAEVESCIVDLDAALSPLPRITLD